MLVAVLLKLSRSSFQETRNYQYESQGHEYKVGWGWEGGGLFLKTLPETCLGSFIRLLFVA